MRHYSFTLLLLAVLILVGCQSGVTNIPVSPNSDLGRQMLELDATGRAVQNAPLFSKAMLDFEAAHGGKCTDVTFDRLQEPGKKISRYVRLYLMEGLSPTCGRLIYYARITFDDSANTVVNREEIIEGAHVPSQDEEPSYRQKAQEFIQYAQSGNVQQMLAITSPLTHPTQDDSVRTIYAEQVVPQFQRSVVTWDAHGTPTIDEQNNGGLAFTGTAHGKKIFSFNVIVYRENGKLVVANIQKDQ
jgi:hypothetical protein